MSEFNDIEELLRNDNLPHRYDTGHMRHLNWQRVLQEHRQRRQLPFLFRIPPWIWSLASIMLIIVCIFIFMLLK